MSEAEKELEKQSDAQRAAGEDPSRTESELDRVQRLETHARNVDHRHKHNDI